MADLFGRLVVRSHAPRRRAIYLALAVFLAMTVLYGAFELGRYDAGFRVVDSVRGALSASSRIAGLEAENARQREQLAAAEPKRTSLQRDLTLSLNKVADALALIGHSGRSTGEMLEGAAKAADRVTAAPVGLQQGQGVA